MIGTAIDECGTSVLDNQVGGVEMVAAVALKATKAAAVLRKIKVA